MRSGLALACAAALVLGPRIAAASRADTAAALVRYLPDAATQILVVDVGHARSSAALGTILTQLRGYSPRWDAVGADGVELDRAIDLVVLASTETHHTYAIVDGMVGPILAHMKPIASPAAQHGGITYWTIDGAELAIVDHHLMITTPGDMAELIDRAQLHKTGAALHAGNRDALHAIVTATSGTGADVWGGIVPTLPVRQFIEARFGGEPLWVAVGLGVSARVSVDVRVATTDEPTARILTDKARGMLVGPDASLPLEFMGLDFADSVVIEQQGHEIHAAASMSIDVAVQSLRSVLGN